MQNGRKLNAEMECRDNSNKEETHSNATVLSCVKKNHALFYLLQLIQFVEREKESANKNETKKCYKFRASNRLSMQIVFE